MSGDEVFVLAMSGFVCALTWSAWYGYALRVRGFRSASRGRTIVALAPLLAALSLFLVLRTAAASDVRDAPRYIVLYLVLGAAWVGACTFFLPLLGVSARDDVTERGNRAAAYAIGGAVIAIALCYAGGNIGDGPGWWVVVFSAALATAALFGVWLLLENLGRVADAVTIERDVAAGVRLAGFLIAIGLIFGRAVAGDWESAAATVRDFLVLAWPALLLLGGAAFVERASHPTIARPAPAVIAFGALPALAYITVAAIYVVLLGPA